MSQPEHLSWNYIAADHYTSGVPQPPRIGLPAPTLGSTAVADLQSARPLFLPEGVPYNPEPLPPVLHDWKYNDRRKAQQILPYLYLGSTTVTRDQQWLLEQGITFAIGVHTVMPRVIEAALQRLAQHGIKTMHVDALDDQDLIRTFRATFNLIKDHVNETLMAQGRPRILVFDESGNERSAAIVVAFLMEAYENIDFAQAIRAVQTLRFCVVAAETDKQVLQGYWDIICARRAVAATQDDGGGRSKKRRVGGDDEDQGEGQDDMARFADRHHAPFEERMDLF